ncbi:maleylpyruvate isomerase N-terminal domain-containing protein [Actinokineospora inagensis]|uniref:maleylpyruvate isomerase N-terminal domain-containing protein n=1 Tax=Actinokineospora inagensis TaxID=103730 RepID=UPI00042166A4|nr:maleylpyruvate isomerase N-terminal domain-containing protein [Actinokineospora inagensis]
MSKEAFLSAATTALTLLRDPAVAAEWEKPSALAEFRVAGLAGHLAYQVLVVPEVLALPPATEERIPLSEHYARAAWIDSGLDSEINSGIRAGGDQIAADGPSALADQVEAAIATITPQLADPTPRNVRMRLWGPWSLSIEDLLTTRTMELVVHSDDLAVSVGVPTPEFTPETTQLVLNLLIPLATRRHGPLPIIRALTRTERTPTTIAAF